MKCYKNVFSVGHSKLLSSALLLAATSSLLACGQPNNSASGSMPVSAEPAVAIQTTQPDNTQSNISPVMLPSKNQSTLLQNVSATVYKDANCGCCKEWISHAEGHGLSATANDVANLSLFKERYGVPPQMQSCHTAVTTDGYVFEGHVPAKHMAQFLENPPAGAVGLAVPGMPVGSPGMEYQGQFMPYQVMQMNKDGSTAVYAEIDSPEAQL